MNKNKLIDKYNLYNDKKLIKFIDENPENLNINELSMLSEITNNNRTNNAAYYTDFSTIEYMFNHLPLIENKNEIRVLEPSVGIGNFLQSIINKYYKLTKKLIIDVNDIDINSLNILKKLNNYRDIPKNVTINYKNVDFLNESYFYKKRYDLVIGNPPFIKMNKKNGLLQYSNFFSDKITKNMAGFFIQKSMKISNNVFLIMPKYSLNNPDFKETRNRIKKNKINKIIDFGEKGFKGVLIETIAFLINTKESPKYTISYSITKNIKNKQIQKNITDSKYPFWLIYRNKWFDSIAKKMQFNVFTSFRDRQITNKITHEYGDIRIIKSRNISRDGSEIKDISGYDTYVNKKDIKNFSIYKYLNKDNLFLSPNMTYYPRVIKKPKNTLVNGSVAILTPKSNIKINKKQLDFLNSKTFEEFYKIARNFATRSLNIDSNSIFFFGLYKD